MLFYAGALYFGGYLRWNEVKEFNLRKGEERLYSGG